MKYCKEESLTNFEFWSGGADTVEELTDEEIEKIENYLESESPEEGWSDTAINDFFWFERETIAEWLGYDSFDDIIKRNKEEQEEEEQE